MPLLDAKSSVPFCNVVIRWLISVKAMNLRGLTASYSLSCSLTVAMVCMVSTDGNVLAISPTKFHHCCPLSCSPFMLPCISIYSYHFGQGLKDLVGVDTKSSSPHHPVSPLLLLLREPVLTGFSNGFFRPGTSYSKQKRN